MATRRYSGLAATLLALALLGAAGPGQAASRLWVTAARVDWEGIEFHALQVSADPAAGTSLDVAISAAELRGLAALGPVTGLNFACRALAVSAERVACPAGRLSGRFGSAGPQQTPVTLSYESAGDLHARLSRVALAGGRADIALVSRPRGWHAEVGFVEVDPGQFGEIPALAVLVPDGVTLSARASGSATADGTGGEPREIGVRASVASLAFSDERGTLAGEALDIEVDATFRLDATGAAWDVESSAAAHQGQAYLEPVFLDFAARPARLVLAGRLSGDGATLDLRHVSFRQQHVAEVDGEADLDLAGDALLRSARLRLVDIDVAAAVPIYVDPFLVGTHFSDLQGSGRTRGEVEIVDGLPTRVVVDLEDVTLDSVTGSVAVEGLAGEFSWHDDQLRNELAPESDSAIFKSLLSWQSARLWGVEFGAATIPFTTTGRHFRLLDPVVLPVFDGGLAIDTLRIRHAGTERMYLRFDAELKPISMSRLTRALGWPEFRGTLSGRIPRLELADGFVTLGGNLELEAFDGTVTVSNLRLREPLGEFPQLFADIAIERLDLAQVTSTFEFGLITGRMSGYVNGLETFDWAPVAFDASLHSTPGDRSPRRIDQRAVSNLSSIGGGSGGSVTAALQGGFLRFFDSFRYARLGLSCRLENDVCWMDGVEKSGAGYYIVKGAGIPRIDVIGNKRRVAWSRLVRQLAAITESTAPVVE